MQIARVDEPDMQERESVQVSSRDIYRNAGKAFAFIDKYRTPPTPKAYAIWFAYASGSDPLLVARVDHILATKNELGITDIDAIHWEMLEAHTDDAETISIGDAIEKEIGSVLGMIQEGVKSSDLFHASLSEAGVRLPLSTSGADLAILVSSLVEENRRMAETTQELSQGLNESQKQLEVLHTQLESLKNDGLTDALTGVPNRRAFTTFLDNEANSEMGVGEELCLAMADIDYFKQVNDTHGHQIGDEVLKMFTGIIRKNIADHDMVARFGGDEFAIILPRTNIFAAHNLLVKIKEKLKFTELIIDGGEARVSNITASFGLARLAPGMTTPQLIDQADKYLYDAKEAGRDKIRGKGF